MSGDAAEAPAPERCSRSAAPDPLWRRRAKAITDPMGSALSFFAFSPRYAEDLLAAELRALGAASVREVAAGVSFAGPLEIGYRACLWSRVAARILLPLAEFPASTPEQVREGTRAIAWEQHMDVSSTFAVTCTIWPSPLLM